MWYDTYSTERTGTRQNEERGGSPLVSFDHVIDPHFVTFSSSLYTTISNPNPSANPNTNPNPNHIPNPNPNRNPTVITDPQIGPRDPQIVTVQIRSALHFVLSRKDYISWKQLMPWKVPGQNEMFAPVPGSSPAESAPMRAFRVAAETCPPPYTVAWSTGTVVGSLPRGRLVDESLKGLPISITTLLGTSVDDAKNKYFCW